MPRSKKSASGKILDHFRTADAGEIKVLYQLVTDVVRERFAVPSAPKVRKTRKSKAAPAAQSTEEVTQ
jgi:hypothetical protein